MSTSITNLHRLTDGSSLSLIRKLDIYLRMDSGHLHQALDACALDLAYEKCLHQQHSVQEAERFRRLRVQLILLEDRNDRLQAQIADNDDYVKKIEQSQDAFKAKVKKAETSLENTQGEVRIKSREIETLKAELSSLHCVTMDSTKLLTEKLALARELSTLRPEVDHLRSEVASNQSLLAQKLSLDHQVRTLEIQLETEKKSMQRISAQDGKARSEDANFESQLQSVQAELNRERREKQRCEREAQKSSRAWEAQRANSESRLDSLRNKLKTTKDSLKQTQQELNSVRSVLTDMVNKSAATAQGQIIITKPRKRTATQMLSDSMIGTPGNANDDRRTKRVSALPGDKSAFSITPYLNRTASIAPESPPEGSIASLDVVRVDEQPGEAQSPTEVASKDDQTTLAELSNSERSKALDTAKATKINEKVAPRRKKPKTASILEKVAEEENDEKTENHERSSKTIGPTAGDGITLKGFEVKKQRQKLLSGAPGKTLFDGDDREPGKSGSGAAVLHALNRGAGPALKRWQLTTAPDSVFSVFSPLKRNRRSSAK
ncbi:MAG: hypothetical protein Q9213_006744 [Squamulea squamosa]